MLHHSLALLADLEVCVAAGIHPRTVIMTAFKNTPSNLLDLLARRPLRSIFILFIISWLPLSFGPTAWTSEDRARDFLGNLWQVEAAAFGLVIAAALFLFEAYSSSIRGKYGIALQDYARETGITPLVPLLSGAILLTGTTLLGWGNGAPRGWAGALCLVLAASAVAVIPLFFARVMRFLGPEAIDDMQFSALMSAVRQEILWNAKNGSMSRLLAQHLSRWEASLSDLPPSSGTHHPSYILAAPGIPVDLNLRQLQTALRDLRRAIVVLSFGRRLQQSQPVVYATSGSTNPRPATFLHLSESQIRISASGTNALEELHGDSLQAIRDQDQLNYDKSLRKYEFLFGCLLRWDDQAQQWYQYSVFSQPTLRIGLYAKMQRALWIQYEQALRVSDDQLIGMASSFPAKLHQQALEASNVEIANDMTRLLSRYATMELRRT